MKTLFFFFFITGLLLCSCSTQVTTESTATDDSLNALPMPTVFKGLFSNGKFIWCENPRIIFLIQDETKENIDTLYKNALPGAYSKQTAFVELRGEIPENKNKDILIVKEVLKIERKSPANNCIPFEYWCSGNDPSWEMQISETEDLIDLYQPLEGRTVHFNYKAPVEDQGKLTYSVQNDSSASLFVVISNEFCNDGASEKKYNFKVNVIYNGKKLNGCALKYGEPVN